MTEPTATVHQPAPAPTRLVIKVTCGVERAETTNQAFSVAASALAAGVEVSLWLAGEASWFAIPGRASDLTLEHAAPLPDLLEAILAAGSVTLCTQCAVRREIDIDALLPGIRVAGAPSFVEEIMTAGVQALVY